MPLRAKITNPAMSGKRTYSQAAPVIDSLPEDPPEDVIFASKYGVRTIQLNRPDKLNSLNGSMARKIIPRLQEWQKSQMANVVVIKGAGRAFCAGGDVAVLAQDCATGAEGQQRSKDYFALEYQLDHLIATYPKPYVAFIDGITMGGGVGLSAHAPFRIATERTVFAMPETTIGFFPDVGASFFLSRMDGGLGLYLAMTSERLKGPEAYFAGIATHYIHSTSLPDLEARLAELQFPDTTGLGDRMSTIDRTIEEFSTGLPHDMPHHIDTAIRQAIDYVFNPTFTPTQILSQLRAVESATATPANVKEWARKTEATIRERSPTSVAVTVRQVAEGAGWDIGETFKREYGIAARFMEHGDFVTGVTARLISKEKGRPKWKPATLDEVTEAQVETFFAKGSEEELVLLNQDPEGRYKTYPYGKLGLPSESDIRGFWRDLKRESEQDQGVDLQDLREACGKMVADQYKGKIGVEEKVVEVVGRIIEQDKRQQ